MHDVLGYEQFGAQGCDWGAVITAQLGHKYPDSLVGVHMNMPVLLGHERGSAGPEEFGPDEAGWYERSQERMRPGQIHLVINRNEPQTLAYALNDSPVGLAAWILQRRRNFGDTRGNIERRLSKDWLLTGIMIYWLTETFGTAMRYYWEDVRDPWQPVHPGTPVLTVPTGFAVYPAEPVHIPRAVAERETNLVHWSVLPAGGHYAAAEEPELFVDDLRAFFRKVR
jgi:pimeloyl-ACP methyl ester carboxylesterase